MSNSNGKLSFSFAPTKTSRFGLKKKPISTRPFQTAKDDDSDDADHQQQPVKREIITGIVGNEIQSTQPQKLVIRMRSRREETATSAATDTKDNEERKNEGTVNTAEKPKETTNASNSKYSATAFGLQLMSQPSSSTDTTMARPVKQSGPLSFTPLKRAADADSFQSELDCLPESAPVDRYKEIPVEEFGAALLRGMGWKDGDALGPNKNGLATPVEFKRRPTSLGLGAEATDLDLTKATKRKKNKNSHK
jgi:hypothetical protein